VKDALTYRTVLDSQARKKAKIVDDPANQGDWWRIATYGGSLAENVTQAVARDLLAEAMLRLDAAGARVVLHVHDEAVIEVPSSAPAAAEQEAKRIMTEVPKWAHGIPIATDGWRGKRYRK
jgi:DNA polymerase